MQIVPDPDRVRIRAFWSDYVHSLPPGTLPPDAPYQAWGFGDSPEMANALGLLVRDGVKNATASLLWAYEADGEPLPLAGDHSIIIDGSGQPLCIIRTTRVYILPFSEVDEEQAYLEGEGDRSLAFWRDVHWDFFRRECAEMVASQPFRCRFFAKGLNSSILEYRGLHAPGYTSMV